MNRYFILCFITLLHSVFICGQSDSKKARTHSNFDDLEKSLSYYPVKPIAQVMVVGMFHFNEKMLSENNQENLKTLLKTLSNYKPTKVVLELEPAMSKKINENYSAFLKDSFDISNRYNEVYQIGFKLAEQLKHDRVYLFDNQTEFIGSLGNFRDADDPFSFQKFSDYAQSNDNGFYNRYEKELIGTFDANLKLLNDLPPYERIVLMNSDKHTKINAQRMHMYELRVGIQKNWVGPDWVGRFYQRNLRMAGNILKIMEPKDKILILVGDNHKWALDGMFNKIPDIDLVSSWEILKQVN